MLTVTQGMYSAPSLQRRQPAIPDECSPAAEATIFPLWKDPASARFDAVAPCSLRITVSGVVVRAHHEFLRHLQWLLCVTRAPRTTRCFNDSSMPSCPTTWIMIQNQLKVFDFHPWQEFESARERPHGATGLPNHVVAAAARNQ